MNSDVHDFESLHEENTDTLDLNADQDFPTQNVVHSNGNVSSVCGDPMLQVGTEFETDDHAYTFYNRYAKLVGFSVRKDWVNRSKVHGQVVSRKFTCSREGYRRRDKRDISVKKRRKETRTGCLAHMIITRQPDGRYRVSHFEERHNHDNVNPENAQTLIPRDSSLVLDQSPEEGDYSSLVKRSRQCQHSVDEFPSTEFDYHLKTERAGGMKEGEAGRLLQYFQRKRSENPSFFYLLQLDVDDRVSNIFWADDGMVSDYGHFGDVVCLDTLFRTKKDYHFPLVQFVGLNNHGQVVIFASALLYDDTVESFRWLFRTFLEAMSGKKPKAIHSDQDAVIVEAIDSVLPETDRSICVWQMYENSVKHLSNVVLDTQSFACDFKSCIYSAKDEEDFSRSWDELLEKYSLPQNEWLKWMFREKEKWALVYEKNTFFVDSNGSHLSEILHDDLRSYSNSGLDVLRFFKHLEAILEEIRYKEVETNDEIITPRLMANIIMLRHASSVYTPRAFESFQRGYEKSLNVVVNEQSENGSLSFHYKAKKFGQSREYYLTFDSSDDSISCSCKKFESVGFLCSHALKVLDHRNIKVVPPKYISKRWTREARLGNVIETRETTMASRYRDLSRRVLTLSSRACESEEAFLFASRKLDEAFEVVEKILGSKHEGAPPTEASNASSSSSQSDQPEVFLEENGIDEQIENGKGSSGVSSLPVFVSPQTTTGNTIMQEMYSFEVNQAVKCIYQQPSLVIDPNTNPNMYQPSNFFANQHDSATQSQLLQEPLIHSSYPESITNTAQEMDLDIQHPHSASFLLFDQRYRTTDTNDR